MATLNELVTSIFGKNFRVSQGFSSSHDGVDVAAPRGTPVYAVASGTVEYARNSAGDPNAGSAWAIGGGNVVNIGIGGNRTTQYAHLDSIAVKPGERVEKGELIGTVGSTGKATGPHLHFGLWDRLTNKQVDPTKLSESGSNIDDIYKKVGQQHGVDVDDPINLNPFDALADTFTWLGFVLVGIVLVFGGILLLGLGKKGSE